MNNLGVRGTKSSKTTQPQVTQPSFNRPGAEPRAGKLRSQLRQAYQREPLCSCCGHLFPPWPVINGHTAPSITRQLASAWLCREAMGPVLICKLAGLLT